LSLTFQHIDKSTFHNNKYISLKEIFK